MAEHKYSKEIAALVAGEKLQFTDAQRCSVGWIDFDPEFHNDVASTLLTGREFKNPRYALRIKPKTVKIGNREIEAPVLKPAKGRKVYAVWPDGMQSEWVFRSGDFQHEEMAAAGFFYSTQDAANSAREAITVLLTGKE